MHRLFVAIRPPGRVRERLSALMGGVAGARWVTEEQMHLTLRFIGEVDRHRGHDVHAALGSIHHPRFELSLNGVGSFDKRGEPATLWAGVSPESPLKALHKKIDQALLQVGIAPDRRAYHPHITLARLGPGTGSIAPLLETRGGLSGERFTVASYLLFESRLGPQRAVHEVVGEYPLD